MKKQTREINQPSQHSQPKHPGWEWADCEHCMTHRRHITMPHLAQCSVRYTSCWRLAFQWLFSKSPVWTISLFSLHSFMLFKGWAGEGVGRGLGNVLISEIQLSSVLQHTLVPFLFSRKDMSSVYWIQNTLMYWRDLLNLLIHALSSHKHNT